MKTNPFQRNNQLDRRPAKSTLPTKLNCKEEKLPDFGRRRREHQNNERPAYKLAIRVMGYQDALAKARTEVEEDASRMSENFPQHAWQRAEKFVARLAMEHFSRGKSSMDLPAIHLDPGEGLTLWWKKEGTTIAADFPELSSEFPTFAGTSSDGSRFSEPLRDDEVINEAIRWMARKLNPKPQN